MLYLIEPQTPFSFVVFALPHHVRDPCSDKAPYCESAPALVPNNAELIVPWKRETKGAEELAGSFIRGCPIKLLSNWLQQEWADEALWSADNILWSSYASRTSQLATKEIRRRTLFSETTQKLFPQCLI